MSEISRRQQIYDRIRSSSRDQFVLEEMQKLGFWKSNEANSVPESLIKKEAELQKELSELLKQDRKYADQAAMLKEMRKVRMKAAKEKRAETKEKNKQKAESKAAAWKDQQSKDIIYLGKNYSGGLSNKISDKPSLEKYGLPYFENLVDFSKHIDVPISELRFLCFNRLVSKNDHFYTFEVAKKSGGKRIISAPKKSLKNAQKKVIEKLLVNFRNNENSHGFITGKSIVTNSEKHTGKDIVINLDLENFFPTITYARVKGLFHKCGYSEQIATILALLLTKNDKEKISIDGQTYYVSKGERYLPQGSPASPAISNILSAKLDKRLNGLAKRYNCEYTRYADDLSFSCMYANEENISKLLYYVSKVIVDEGFKINKTKTHIMRKGNQQKVTGIVVNEKLNIPKVKLKKFRALLHNIKCNGWKDQKWGNAIHLINAIDGYINFVHMVNPEKAIKFKKELNEIKIIHGTPEIIKPTVVQNTAVPAFELKEVKQESTQSIEENKKLWWNIF
jgi:retron-type reverse transcriptase